MIELIFRSMLDCPGYKNFGRGFALDADHTRMMRTIRYELGRLSATDVVMEAGFRPDQIRQDGYPYSSQSPVHPTVRLSFKAGKKSLAFTCGGHKDWVVNVYAIAKTLEALRAVERYGCTTGGQQYAGWSQLPPGASSIAAAEWASVEDAMRWLWRVGFGTVPSPLPMEFDAAYRAAAKKSHPDAGGTAELMSKVNRARDFIDASGGAR